MRRASINERIKLAYIGQGDTAKDRFVPPLPLSDESIFTEITTAARKLEAEANKYNSIKLLTAFGLLNLIQTESTKHDIETGLESNIEYLAALLLRNNNTGVKVPSIANTHAINQLVNNIMKLCQDFYANRAYREEREKEENWEIIARTSTHYLRVRNETYPKYFYDNAFEMLKPHTQYMEKKYGFNIEHAIEFTQTIFKLFEDNIKKEKILISTTLSKFLSLQSAIKK
jgi:hypothetical protein